MICSKLECMGLPYFFSPNAKKEGSEASGLYVLKVFF